MKKYLNILILTTLIFCFSLSNLTYTAYADPFEDSFDMCDEIDAPEWDPEDMDDGALVNTVRYLHIEEACEEAPEEPEAEEEEVGTEEETPEEASEETSEVEEEACEEEAPEEASEETSEVEEEIVTEETAEVDEADATERPVTAEAAVVEGTTEPPVTALLASAGGGTIGTATVNTGNGILETYLRLKKHIEFAEKALKRATYERSILPFDVNSPLVACTFIWETGLLGSIGEYDLNEDILVFMEIVGAQSNLTNCEIMLEDSKKHLEDFKEDCKKKGIILLGD